MKERSDKSILSMEKHPLWCLHGHALAGVRVQRVQRVQRFDTAFVREGCGGRLRRQYKSCLRRRPPLVPYSTTFPPASLVGLWVLSMVTQFHHANKPHITVRLFHGCFFYSSGRIFLLSGPGVVTTIFSGVMMTAPLVVQAPWKSASAMALNFSTTGPSVT